MFLIRFILLFILVYVYKGEEPEKRCIPSTPFQKIDHTCGSFYDICVKSDDEDCNYFQKACQQCPPTNYTVLMFIDIANIKTRMDHLNMSLNGIKNQLNISNSQTNDNIKNKFNIQVSIMFVLWIIILLYFIFNNYVYRKKIKKCREQLYLNKKQRYPDGDIESQHLITNQNIIRQDGDIESQHLITNQNIIRQEKELHKEIKETINGKDVSSKLKFQIANQFDETELFVSEFDNIIKLKKSICDRNMNMNDYKRMIMKYKSVTLDNNQYLLSCIDSTNIPIFCEFDNNVDVDAMIVIKLKCDNIYPEMLQIWKHQQIKEIKNIISELNKTNYKDLLIFYKSTQLDDDDKTIDYYKIEDNDWIQVVNKSELMQSITMKSIFSAKETISIEFSKSEKVSSIINKSIQKIQHKMATNDFAVFLNKKPLEKDKFIYEYNIDNKSLVEFCYFKSMKYIKKDSRLKNLNHIILYQARYQYKNIDKPILLKGYKKSIMEEEYDKDLSRILREELEIFQITKSHPRFMQLFDIYMDNEWIYIGMENSTKTPMNNFLSMNNEISTYEISKWANQMLEGLKHLHNHNIIMKDMNPMDMWIDGNHDVKLPSFNKTKYLNHLDDDKSKDYKHKPGILAYVAPEILESKPYEASVDVWSLGVIMIEVLKGSQLFPGKSESEAVQTIKESHTIEYDKTDKPEDVINFIDCCVKVDPKERATINGLIKMEFIEKYLL